MHRLAVNDGDSASTPASARSSPTNGVGSAAATERPAPLVPTSPEAREAALTALLDGAGHASELPVSATDPGFELQPGMLKRMTTVEVEVTGPTLEPPLPHGEVAFGNSTATVPVRDADRTIASLRGRVRTCYRTALSGSPSMKGRLVLRASVSPDGAVTATKVQTNTGLPPLLTDCVVAVLERAQFAPPGAAGSTLTVPIAFTLVID